MAAVVAWVTSAVGSAFKLCDALWWFDKVLHGCATFAYTLVLTPYAYGAVLTGVREHRLLVIPAIGGWVPRSARPGDRRMASPSPWTPPTSWWRDT